MESENIHQTVRILSEYDTRVALKVIANKEKLVSRTYLIYYLISVMPPIIGRSRRQIEQVSISRDNLVT